MEFLRRALNPWGQDVLVGVSWDLIWGAVVVGALFVIAHALLVPKKVTTGEFDAAEGAGLPEEVVRHSKGSRAFHWLMAASMFVLLITAFFPLVGIQFPWVQIHWIAGLVLIALVLFHIVHALTKQDIWSMWIGARDIGEGKLALRKALGNKELKRPRSAKYPVDQKMYHHAASLMTVGAIVTGVLMMFRVETSLWTRNPYLFGDGTWGMVYVIHGVCGIALIFLVISHVYFAIRPEKRWMTWSMINGRITKAQYLEHHDPALWDPTEASETRVGEGGGGGMGGLDHAVAREKA
ncbi:MAG: cytochrome b/b6 domain-containing protein [Longimicrobiales bacterium]